MLGIDARSGAYAHAPITADELAAFILAGAKPELRRRADELGVTEQDLAVSGWGVVFPSLPGAAHAEFVKRSEQALAPLILLRELQSGELYRCYRGSLGWREGDTKSSWLARQGIGHGPVDPRRAPRYLLLVGPPTQISFDAQCSFGGQFAVGRLDLTTRDRMWEAPEDEQQAYFCALRAYAVAVVRSELEPKVRGGAAVVCADSDRATALPRGRLAPVMRTRIEEKLKTYWVAGAGKDTMQAALRDNAVGLIVTTSHGISAQPGDPRQRDIMGCWLGNGWRPGLSPSECYVRPSDMGGDLVGKVVFNLACYSAGTPDRDELMRMTDRPGNLTEAPFTSSLHKRLLGLGVIAAIGYVNRCWSSSVSAAGALESFSSAIAAGTRAGAALSPFSKAYVEHSFDLLRLSQVAESGEVVKSRDVVDAWSTATDAGACVLNGDPAARLPVASVPGVRLDGVTLEELLSLSMPATVGTESVYRGLWLAEPEAHRSLVEPEAQRSLAEEAVMLAQAAPGTLIQISRGDETVTIDGRKAGAQESDEGVLELAKLGKVYLASRTMLLQQGLVGMDMEDGCYLVDKEKVRSTPQGLVFAPVRPA